MSISLRIWRVRMGLEFFVDGDDVAEHAREERVSVETAARELRYGFFRYLLGEGNPSVEAADGAAQSRALSKPHLGSTLDKIVTGHTLDDQAETVLMRMIRGTGMRGLGGIYPRLPVEDDSGELCGEIVRPFLALRRRELEAYLKAVGQPWREDSSNANHAFTRNRLRQLILPVLENEFNPAIAETISDLADIARGEEDYWENEISGWMGTVVHWSEPDWARRAATSGLVNINLGISLAPAESSNEGSANDLQSKIESAAWLLMNASISRVWFVTESEAVQRRLIKAIGEHAGIPLEFKHVEEIRRLAAHDSEGKELSLPLGWKFVREADELIFLTPDLRIEPPAHDYEYELSVPGRVIVPEIGAAIQIYRIVGGGSGYNPDHLLDADSLCGPLRVRNWRAGDRFWPAHTKSAKKIKELLQERQISGAGRKLWPVVLIRSDEGDEIIWVRGFPVPAKYAAKPGGSGMVICETPLADE